MSEQLDDLLQDEGVDDVDGLMTWAYERVEALVAKADADPELCMLLRAGGDAGPVPARRPRKEPSSAASLPAAPLPPIPSKARAVARQEQLEEDEEDIEELDIEELDVEELELIEDEDEEGDGGADDDEQDDEGETSTALPKMPPETPSYGPPDGTEDVPEWKAALLSTQTDSDEEAAERVKEASSADPLPTRPQPREHDDAALPARGRLEAEDEEISQHSIDFSDLDLDDE